MNVAYSFGEWLGRRRRVFGLTQSALAQGVGCSVSAIRKLESGERRPSIQIAELLADCLGIPADARATFLLVARGERPVSRLAAPETAPGAPWAPRPSPPRTNLPTPPMPLIGRQAELAQLADLLGDPDCRLLTLVGPGGVGKTHLALAAAAREAAGAARFTDGVYFISLASIGHTAHLTPTVADAVGYTFHEGDTPERQLLTFLRDKRMLLILDNFEHLLGGPGAADGGAFVARLLRHAPGVTSLVTSRERLNVLGERLLETPGLALPDDDVAALDQVGAVALFLASAGRVRPGFALADANRAAIVRICRLVAGMPLGIHLAAAWVHVLSCEEIAAEIERNLDFLAVSMRDMPERQRSLRATFDHSWRLLTEDEQRALRGLAVFRGGFDRPAAETVAGATLPILSALVDKSLVQRATDGRYSLHFLIRQYAADHLAAGRQRDRETRRRHCRYYASLLAGWERPIKGPAQSDLVRAINRDIDNVRLAWEWAVEQRFQNEIQQMADALYSFYELRGWFQEGAAIFERAVQCLRARDARPGQAAPDEVTALGRAMTWYGYFLDRCGRLDAARAYLKESVDILRQSTDLAAQTKAVHWYGVCLYQLGQYSLAGDLLRESLALATQTGDAWDQGVIHIFLGMVAHAQGNYEAARAHFDESLAGLRAVGSPRALIANMIFHAKTLNALEEYGGADALLQESLYLSAATDDAWGAASTLIQRGEVARLTGDYAAARRYLDEALATCNRLGNLWDVARTQVELGRLAVALDDRSAAWGHYQAALAAALDAHSTPYVLEALVGLAPLLAAAGDVATAVRCLAHVRGHPASSREALAQVESMAAKLAPGAPGVGENAAGASLETFAASLQAREGLVFA